VKNTSESFTAKYGIALVLSFLFIFILGIVALIKMDLSFLPRHTEPVLTIVTDYPDMDPELIEKIITKPIEGLLKDVRGIENFYSLSSRGRSRIVVYLYEGQNIDTTGILIEDKLRHISDDFPLEVRKPLVYKYNTDDSPVAIYALSSPMLDRDELSSHLENQLKPNLLSIEGVANVELVGESIEDYFIDLDYDHMLTGGLDFESFFQTVLANNTEAAPGDLETNNDRTRITFPNRYEDPFALTVYSYLLDGRVVPGEGLLRVRRNRREPERVSRVNNVDSMTLYLFRRDDAHLLRLDHQVRQKLLAEPEVEARVLHSEAEEFRSLVGQLVICLVVAGVGILVVVFLLYRRSLYALLIFSAIPLSLAGTIAVLFLFGRSLNLMTLAGLAIGVGMCVDSSMIFVDTFAVVTEGRRTGMAGASLITVERVRRPIILFTVTTIAVFLPLWFSPGQDYSMYGDFALSVSAMLAVSSLYSLLFIPAVIATFSRNAHGQFHGHEHPGDTSRRKTDARTKGIGRIGILRGIARPLMPPVRRRGWKRPMLFLSGLCIVSGLSILFFILSETDRVDPIRDHDVEVVYEF
jgi:HAE1 family hydrophobic/amphiphilic exporter-1